jgi:D-glycero-beta-D-manno-heptose 1-phosphate adenylyltransferase
MPLRNKIHEKIISPAQISSLVSEWKSKGITMVFTNGCFDILHRGHIELLMQASSFGNKLIIGLNSDQSVRKLKGEGRPYNDEQSRALVLASLIFVDAVVLFDEDTPYNLIASIVPEILVKGGDYKENEVAGADIVKGNGGKVIIVDLLKGYSTTMLGKKIREGNS